jgi:PIN domain nuclease of toxin-antitoxin system
MKFLLDTHALLWFFAGDRLLSDTAKDVIDNPTNHKFISVATVWEMTIKQSQGKLELEKLAADYVADKLLFSDFHLLPIELHHLKVISTLDFYHRDPFDRLLISQAIAEELPIIGKDQVFKDYPVQCVW